MKPLNGLHSREVSVTAPRHPRPGPADAQRTQLFPHRSDTGNAKLQGPNAGPRTSEVV